MGGSRRGGGGGVRAPKRTHRVLVVNPRPSFGNPIPALDILGGGGGAQSQITRSVKVTNSIFNFGLVPLHFL